MKNPASAARSWPPKVDAASASKRALDACPYSRVWRPSHWAAWKPLQAVATATTASTATSSTSSNRCQPE